MITCPKCQQSLPDWSQICQFCQTDLKGVARPKGDPNERRPTQNYGEPAKWIWPAYYAIAIYEMVIGVKILVEAILWSMATHHNKIFGDYQATDYVGIILGALTLATGLGLAAKINFIRGVVNFLSFLQILGNLCGMVGTILAGSILGPWVLFGLVIQTFNIVAAGLMIYLIGETD